MRARGVILGLLAAGLGLSTRAGATEPLPSRAERIMSPGRSLAGDDSAETVSINPANLAHLPGGELRWTGLFCADTQKVGCGHSLTGAIPLLFGLTTGLRVDWVMPPDSARFPYAGYDYAWLSWALGYKLGERLSLGVSLQRAYSSNAYVDGLFGVTAGVTFRPYTRFALSAIARDVNAPAPQRLPPNGQPVLDRSYALALALRPTGTRAFELGLETRYLQGTDDWIPRGTAVVEIPGVGRARGDVEVANVANDQKRGVVATAGLELSFGGLTAGGGALFGSGLGANQNLGAYATASIAQYTQEGLPRPARAVWLRVEHTPGTRGHVGLLRRLWRIADAKDVAAITMVIRSEPAATFAHAEELADAFRLLRAKGKKVLCSFEDGGPKALFACASADRIVVNPAGGVRYAGLKTSYFYLAKLLANIGVKAEFVRIGAHKSAPEQFTNDSASDVARADHEDLLRQNEAVFVKNLSVYRHLSEDRVRASTANGPFIAREAREAGFVDGEAFDDELERATQDLVGRKLPYQEWQDDTRAPLHAGPRGKVAILYVDGDMIDGRSQRIPLVDMRLTGSYSIAETVKKLREDGETKAVVLRIESPGGSSLAADVMWRELKLLADKKPLVVSMGSVAASGGYYIASAGRRIYALPLTVTGSIGVFYGKADVSELLRKVGIDVETYKTTPRADAESLFRGFTEDERKELAHKVQQFYDVFLDRVAQGRHMTKAEVDALGQGRVWTGQQAQANKLVDRLGGMREALDAAREMSGLPDDAPIVEVPSVDQTLLEKMLELAGVRAGAMSIEGLPVQVRDVARAIAPMAVYASDVPLARAEWVPLEDATGKDEE
jgi:protease IV